MSTMTLLSTLGHIVAMLTLIMLAWIEPIRIRRPRRRVDVRMIQRTPAPPTAKPRPRITPRTPKPATPKEKTIQRKTRTPTPKPKTPKPKTPKPKTPKPKTPKPKTPKPKTPRPKTPSPRPRTPPRTTPPPAKATPVPGTSITPVKSQLDEYDYLRSGWVTKIEDNFHPPRHLRTEGIRCLIRATIFRDGRVENIRVLRSTGDSMLDDKAITALKRSSPLSPFPDTVKLPYSEEEFEFDYSVKER